MMAMTTSSLTSVKACFLSEIRIIIPPNGACRGADGDDVLYGRWNHSRRGQLLFATRIFLFFACNREKTME